MTWDEYHLGMAEYVKSKSKDPSTQVGAVLVRPDRTVVSTGYNGFPRGVEDREDLYADRAQKYPRVVHAELNAILTAREDLTDCVLYCTLFPCCECAKAVIQSGIKEVVVPTLEKNERYYDSMTLTQEMFEQAGVTLRTPDSA